MVYYGYSYFYIFFLFFLFLLLFLIILSPNYSKKDVVPPLTTQNYGIDVSDFTLSNLYSSDSDARFIRLMIQDGEGGSGGSALDFGGPEHDTVPVDFNTEYEYKNRRVTGYFVLYLENSGLTAPTLPSFLFRVVDTHDPDYHHTKNTLGEYNKGFAGLTMTFSGTGEHQPLYKVVVPFDVPSQKEGHNLQVQIAPMMHSASITNGDILLNSAYIYYY
jgi:hypothetical protein